MNQSRACRLGESILALLLFFTLAFAPLCQARAQEPSAGSLASAQVQSAGLTESSGEVVEQSNASSKVSYQGVCLAKSAKTFGAGWSAFTFDQTVGDMGGKGLTSLKLELRGLKGLTGHVRYQTYQRAHGWGLVAKDGAATQAVRNVEAVKIRLSGAVAQHYDVIYRAYLNGSGWQPWVKNGAMAGLVNAGKRVLAVRVMLVPKTEEALGDSTSKVGIFYQMNYTSAGWESWRRDGATAGKVLQQMAGFTVKLDKGTLSGGVRFSAYSSKGGWGTVKSAGSFAAAPNNRLEAFNVALVGEIARNYDVYYRAYVQGVGWLDWAHEGETAGNIGYGLPVNALQMKLVKEGAAAPGDTFYPTVNQMEASKTMDGIDISSWQAGIDVASVQADFIIVKATGGTDYVNPYYAGWADAVLASGKQLGFYHYAREAYCPGSAAQEAAHFINAVRPYIGKAVLFLDFEGDALEMGDAVQWAKEFMDTVYVRTGVKPLLYISQSVTWRFDWSSVASTYKLWVAQYLYRNFYTGYLENPEGGTDLGYWPSAQLYQYSSTGSVNGYGAELDLNKFYGSVRSWKMLARKS